MAEPLIHYYILKYQISKELIRIDHKYFLNVNKNREEYVKHSR